MKVKFLRSGIEAHSESKLGNFTFRKGEEMSGLSEETASQMASDGNAEIINELDDDPDEGTLDPDDEFKDDEPKKKTPWGK
jgi:hypothetical protein